MMARNRERVPSRMTRWRLAVRPGPWRVPFRALHGMGDRHADPASPRAMTVPKARTPRSRADDAPTRILGRASRHPEADRPVAAQAREHRGPLPHAPTADKRAATRFTPEGQDARMDGTTRFAGAQARRRDGHRQDRRDGSRTHAVPNAVQAVRPAGSGRPCARRHAVSVLARRQAIVIGPTPPGTGVMAPATAAAPS